MVPLREYILKTRGVDLSKTKLKNKNNCQNGTKHDNLLDAFRFNLKHHQ